MSFEKIKASVRMGELFEWHKWSSEIPRLKFKSDWEVQVIPPFFGVVVRFIVYKNSKLVSVYLDCYENLGHFGGPHWEIYPDKEGGNSRFAINETEELLMAIESALNPSTQDYAE